VSNCTNDTYAACSIGCPNTRYTFRNLKVHAKLVSDVQAIALASSPVAIDHCTHTYSFNGISPRNSPAATDIQVAQVLEGPQRASDRKWCREVAPSHIQAGHIRQPRQPGEVLAGQLCFWQAHASQFLQLVERPDVCKAASANVFFVFLFFLAHSCAPLPAMQDD